MQKNPKNSLILLVSPPITKRPKAEDKGKRRLKIEPPTTLPLGLAYLAAALEEKGLNVEARDWYNLYPEEVEKEIRKIKPKIIGVSAFTDYRDNAIAIAEIAKKVDKEIVTVCGGPHATFMWEQMLENYPEIDYVTLGESEVTFPELAKKILAGENASGVKGIALRKNGKPVKTDDRPLVKSLNDLPMPARHKFDLSVYQQDYLSFYDINRRNWLDGKKVSELKQASVVSSRGCPFKCTYCSTTLFWGLCYRWNSTERTMKELAKLYREGVRFFNFVDDNFTAVQDRTQDLCKKIIGSGMKVRWVCGSRVGSLTEETLRLMKEAGCIHIGFGVETGSPQMLKNINKAATQEQIIETFDLLNKVGVNSTMLLMIGNQGESEESINETIRVMKRCRPTLISSNITMVYPATRLYEIAKEKGFIDDAYWLDREKASPIYTAEQDIKTLRKWKSRIDRAFWFSALLRPQMWLFALSNIGRIPKGIIYLINKIRH